MSVLVELTYSHNRIMSVSRSSLMENVSASICHLEQVLLVLLWRIPELEKVSICMYASAMETASLTGPPLPLSRHLSHSGAYVEDFIKIQTRAGAVASAAELSGECLCMVQKA